MKKSNFNGGLFFAFVLITLVIIAGIRDEYRINRLEHPVTPTEVFTFSVEQSLIADGWTQECVSSINVSKHKYVDEYVGSNCPYPIIRVTACPNDDVGDCFKICYNGDLLDNITVPAHVEYYNESVCTKYTLVKVGIEESMSWN